MRNSKGIRNLIIGVVIFAVLLVFLDMAFYPCTYLRNDIHTLSENGSDVLILGTSNGKMGLEPDLLLEGTGLTGHNAAAGSEYPVDSFYITKLAIEKQAPKMILYEIDPGYFTTEKEPGNNYLLFLHEFPLSASKLSYSAAILKDCDFRTLFFPFYEYPLQTSFARMGDSLGKKLSGDYSVESLKNKEQAYHENGFIEKFPVKEADFPAYTPEPFSEDLLVQENLDYLDRMIDLCEEKGILFVAVTMPLPDHALQLAEEKFERTWDFFSGYFGERNIKYYNFNREQYKSYSHRASHYVDYDGHLNGDSAREFSGIFGGMLKAQGWLPES